MYVVARHTVKDPDAFFSDIPGVARNAPAGVHARLFCPSSDKASAVCLWEAGSVEAVRSYLDGVSGSASENTYFQVSEEYAVGLPETLAGAH